MSKNDPYLTFKKFLMCNQNKLARLFPTQFGTQISKQMSNFFTQIICPTLLVWASLDRLYNTKKIVVIWSNGLG